MNFLKIKGSVTLGKEKQRKINGGKRQCDQYNGCPSGQCCSGGAFYPIGTPGRLCEPQIPRNDWEW